MKVKEESEKVGLKLNIQKTEPTLTATAPEKFPDIYAYFFFVKLKKKIFFFFFNFFSFIFF